MICDASTAWQTAFDHVNYIEVLPKFNGSYARLHGLLTSLLEWAKNPDQLKARYDEGGFSSEDEGDDDEPMRTTTTPKLSRVASRVEQMLKTIEANGFVSFG